MRREVTIWIAVVVIVVVLVIVGAFLWRATRPAPEIRETPEQEAQMEEAKRRAFELQERPEKYGSKIVPSPYAPQQRQQPQGR